MSYDANEFENFAGKHLPAGQVSLGQSSQNIGDGTVDQGRMNVPPEGASQQQPATVQQFPTSGDPLLQTVQALLEQNSQMLRMLQINNQQSPSVPKQNYQVMPDLSKTISYFSGETGPNAAQLWLQQVENLALIHCWPDSFKFQTAVSHLCGAAKYWYEGRASTLLDWSSFRKSFEKSFMFGRSKTEIWKAMIERVQQSRESISLYFHEKFSLCQQLHLSFTETKEQIIIGLSSRDLSNFLMSRNHVDEDDLFHDIVEYERVCSFRRGRMPNYGVKDVRDNKPTVKKEDVKSNPNLQMKNIARCFNCNEIGHMLSTCPRPRRMKGSCYLCGSHEHLRSSCPQRSSSQVMEAKPPQRNTLLVDRKQAPAYLVPVEFEAREEEVIKKVCVQACLDTGSPISLVKSNVLPFGSYNVNNDSIYHDYVGINGEKLNILGVYDGIVKIQNTVVPLSFFVVPETTMCYSALIGRDFTTLEDFEVTVGNELSILDKRACHRESMIVNDASNDLSPIMFIDFDNHEPKSDLKINPDLDYRLQNEVTALINDYLQKPRPEQADIDFECKIILKDDQPFSFRPRKLSYAEKNELQKILDDLLSKNIIRESYSEYCSPVVLLKKKNGTEYRLCVDYRELNKKMVRDHFPLPLIDDQLELLKDKCYFTHLDLRNGFHHIKMSSDSIKYTSFVTPLGQFEYLRLPFGTSNGPPVFCRYIRLIFHTLIKQSKILVFLDDLLIATSNISEHLEILKEVLSLMVQNVLELRLDKCSFLMTKTIYLGYEITSQGIKPNPENILAVAEYPIPDSQKKVQRFLGLASYFRRFIPNFAVLAKPLYDLIRKDVEFRFGELEFQVFQEIKQKLVESPVLAIYSPLLETELHCDACSRGYGAILLQKQKDNLFRPVFYFSKRTTESESKFHSYELELLAIVNALTRFHVFLQGIKFKIVTDCNSIKLALNKKEINPRINRWALILQNYVYKLEHREGNKMKHVDALSRVNSVLILDENTFEQNLAVAQNLDENIKKLKADLQTRQDKNFELQNGLVYKKHKNKILFYVPQAMEAQIIQNCHDRLGHYGESKTTEYILRSYWFPNMREKTKLYIANCLKCLTYSPNYGKTEGTLHNIPKGDKPFITVHIDHYGPLEKTTTGKKYIFEVIDAFTKYVKLYDVKSTKTIELIHKLEEYFNYFSKPLYIVSDRGSSFTSKEFEAFVLKHHIIHIKIATSSPKSNGQIERTNRDLTPMLSKLTDFKNKWNKCLPQVEFAINNTFCSSTKVSPSLLLFGVNQRDRNDDLRNFIDTQNSSERDLELLRRNAHSQVEKHQRLNKQYFDKCHKTPHKYQEGDFILIRNYDVTPNVNKKLIPKYKGPYQVKKVFENDRYLVSDIDDFQITQRPFEGVFGPENMRLWLHPE